MPFTESKRYSNLVTGKHAKSRLLLGLTGGIGSGKSAVAAILRDQGIPVIDADQLARQILEKGSPALAEIAAAFGPQIFDSDGNLDRAQLRKIIFTEPEKRQQLEAITHPRIRDLGRKLAASYFATGYPIVVYEAPLLIEAKNYDHLDSIIGVFADDSVRIDRILARDHVNREDAARAIAAQMPQEEKMRYCSHVIQNNGDLAQLEAQVLELLDRLEY